MGFPLDFGRVGPVAERSFIIGAALSVRLTGSRICASRARCILSVTSLQLRLKGKCCYR